MPDYDAVLHAASIEQQSSGSRQNFDWIKWFNLDVYAHVAAKVSGKNGDLYTNRRIKQLKAKLNKVSSVQ